MAKRKRKRSESTQSKKPKKNKMSKEEEPLWKSWELNLREPKVGKVKWDTLNHKGPLFPPPYKRLPKSVKFRYEGETVKLSKDAEEIAGFYARFIGHKNTKNKKFKANFFKDWHHSMTPKERARITDLNECDFSEIKKYYERQSEESKLMSKKKKLKIKKEKDKLNKKHGVATIDGRKEKIGNFRIEPPGLFQGRGNHPKMGMLKKRVEPEHVIINCSKGNRPRPPKGRKWKEVINDKTVSWLACWMDPLQGKLKYVMLSATSNLKGKMDWMKYHMASKLSEHIDNIRLNYRDDFKSEDMQIRQRAVALYFIDKLALRAGNEKDKDQADTVGCCSLRYEHIKLIDKKDRKENIVAFDFLGKDSIQYKREVPVEKSVYDNLKDFMKKKKKGHSLFDRLNPAVLNKHLSELMDGLTVKVFRTYNASHSFQQKLDELTPADGTVAEKMLAYNRANRFVAILCNHQRAVPKTHQKTLKNLAKKIKAKKDAIKKVEKELREAKKGTTGHEKKSAQLKRFKDQLQSLEINLTDKQEGKEIALGTSKLNYLDPRISIAWCNKYKVQIDKIHNKTQQEKFRWAMTNDQDYRFG